MTTAVIVLKARFFTGIINKTPVITVMTVFPSI